MWALLIVFWVNSRRIGGPDSQPELLYQNFIADKWIGTESVSLFLCQYFCYSICLNCQPKAFLLAFFNRIERNNSVNWHSFNISTHDYLCSVYFLLLTFLKLNFWFWGHCRFKCSWKINKRYMTLLFSIPQLTFCKTLVKHHRVWHWYRQVTEHHKDLSCCLFVATSTTLPHLGPWLQSSPWQWQICSSFL